MLPSGEYASYLLFSVVDVVRSDDRDVRSTLQSNATNYEHQRTESKVKYTENRYYRMQRVAQHAFNNPRFYIIPLQQILSDNVTFRISYNICYNVCVCMCVYIYIYLCVCVCMCVCVFVCVARLTNLPVAITFIFCILEVPHSNFVQDADHFDCWKGT